MHHLRAHCLGGGVEDIDAEEGSLATVDVIIFHVGLVDTQVAELEGEVAGIVDDLFHDHATQGEIHGLIAAIDIERQLFLEVSQLTGVIDSAYLEGLAVGYGLTGVTCHRASATAAHLGDGDRTPALVAGLKLYGHGAAILHLSAVDGGLGYCYLLCHKRHRRHTQREEGHHQTVRV